MKSIKKITKTVAGSALLVGATLAGASAMGAAQDSGSSGNTLGDYPAPFVDEDGTVDGTTVVVGNSAKTADVLGATNVAAALGNAAFTSEMVSSEGGNFGWSATNGVTLDTQNDQLYFGDQLNEVRQTLTEDNLEILSETTFTDDSNEDTDVTNYLDIGNQNITFGNSPDGLDNEDPVVHVPVPAESSVDENNYLFSLQANFEESLDFTNEDVAGEDIELFGTTYTVAEDNTNGDTEELVLYGSQETVSVSTDEEAQTITVDGNEVTLSVTAVTGSNTAAIEVNGDLEEYNEDEEFTVEGQEIRVDNIIQTSSDQSAGTVTFAIGSQEIVLQNEQAIQDSDGDDIEGSYVEFNGGSQNDISSISSIDVYAGAEDDDEDYLAAEDSFMHSALPGVEVHFGGLNPDTQEDGAEVEVSTAGDDTATLDVPMGDSSTSLGFAYSSDDSSNGDVDLADEDDDSYRMVEGQAVGEDEYVATDAGDFSHMWEVTDISVESGEESTVDVRDVATGDTRELELPEADGTGEPVAAQDEEIIDGQTYYVWIDDSGSNPTVKMTWGDEADYMDEGDELTTFAPMDAPTGHAATFTSEQELPGFVGTSDVVQGTGETFTADNDASDESIRLGSNISGTTGVDVELRNSSGLITTVTLNDDENQWEQFNISDGVAVEEVRVIDGGQNSYNVIITNEERGGTYTDSSSQTQFSPSNPLSTAGTVDIELPSTESTDAQVVEGVDISTNSQIGAVNNTGQVTYNVSANGGSNPTISPAETAAPSAVLMHPENDDDNENAYIVTPNYDNSDDEVTVTDVPTYTGMLQGTTLESDDDIEARYDEYGAYSETQTDEQGGFSLMVAGGQAVAGAAVTGADGSLSAGGSSGSVQSMMPTYDGEGFPASDFVALDNENPSQLKQNDLILVGGPAVNNLVSELAEANKTWAGDQYEEGDQVIDLVNDAFTDGQDALVVAGYNAGDTRAAARSVANWGEWDEDVSDMNTVNLATQ